jgi:hypothetical protein
MNIILNVSCPLLVLALLISGCGIHLFASEVVDCKGRSIMTNVLSVLL